MPRPELITRAGAALLEIAVDPDRTMKQLARDLGWPERDLRRQLAQLEAAGALTRQRIGNRNRYEIHREVQTGGLLRERTVGEFLDGFRA